MEGNSNTFKSARRSPQMSGLVLHILIQSQDTTPAGDTEIATFKELCFATLKRYTNIISCVATNALIGVFAEDSKMVPDTLAVKCIDEIRKMFYDYRKKGATAFLRASINSGEIIVGCSTGECEYEVLGDAVNASFQIIDTTHPMQVSITRRVRQKVQGDYNVVARCPVDIGIKKAQLFYLHTSTAEICAVPQNF